MNNICDEENDNIKHVIERQLEVLYVLAEMKHSNTKTIRQWFITVMIAFFSVIISRKLGINTYESIIMTVAIVFLFWWLEMINQFFAQIEYNFIETLELITIHKDYKSFDPEKHLVVTSAKYPNKIKILINTIYLSKTTLLLFYLPIFLIVLFILYCFPCH
ncbi:MAG: hypothetical protein JXB48_02670 [Candidatus Latescibacteria bacterium]|nr:hypothetical protein [Candidatus Latescibacterota bacterium]